MSANKKRGVSNRVSKAEQALKSSSGNGRPGRLVVESGEDTPKSIEKSSSKSSESIGNQTPKTSVNAGKVVRKAGRPRKHRNVDGDGSTPATSTALQNPATLSTSGPLSSVGAKKRGRKAKNPESAVSTGRKKSINKRALEIVDTSKAAMEKLQKKKSKGTKLLPTTKNKKIGKVCPEKGIVSKVKKVCPTESKGAGKKAAKELQSVNNSKLKSSTLHKVLKGSKAKKLFPNSETDTSESSKMPKSKKLGHNKDNSGTGLKKVKLKTLIKIKKSGSQPGRKRKIPQAECEDSKKKSKAKKIVQSTPAIISKRKCKSKKNDNPESENKGQLVIKKKPGPVKGSKKTVPKTSALDTGSKVQKLKKSLSDKLKIKKYKKVKDNPSPHRPSGAENVTQQSNKFESADNSSRICETKDIRFSKTSPLEPDIATNGAESSKKLVKNALDSHKLNVQDVYESEISDCFKQAVNEDSVNNVVELDDVSNSGRINTVLVPNKTKFLNSSVTKVELLTDVTDSEDINTQSTIDSEDVTTRSTLDSEDVNTQSTVESERVTTPCTVDSEAVNTPGTVDSDQVNTPYTIDSEDVNTQSTVDSERINTPCTEESENAIPPLSVDSEEGNTPGSVFSEQVNTPCSVLSEQVNTSCSVDSTEAAMPSSIESERINTPCSIDADDPNSCELIASDLKATNVVSSQSVEYNDTKTPINLKVEDNACLTQLSSSLEQKSQASVESLDLHNNQSEEVINTGRMSSFPDSGGSEQIQTDSQSFPIQSKVEQDDAKTASSVEMSPLLLELSPAESEVNIVVDDDVEVVEATTTSPVKSGLSNNNQTDLSSEAINSLVLHTGKASEQLLEVQQSAKEEYGDCSTFSALKDKNCDDSSVFIVQSKLVSSNRSVEPVSDVPISVPVSSSKANQDLQTTPNVAAIFIPPAKSEDPAYRSKCCTNDVGSIAETMQKELAMVDCKESLTDIGLSEKSACVSTSGLVSVISRPSIISSSKTDIVKQQHHTKPQFLSQLIPSSLSAGTYNLNEDSKTLFQPQIPGKDKNIFASFAELEPKLHEKPLSVIRTTANPEASVSASLVMEMLSPPSSSTFKLSNCTSVLSKISKCSTDVETCSSDVNYSATKILEDISSYESESVPTKITSPPPPPPPATISHSSSSFFESKMNYVKARETGTLASLPKAAEECNKITSSPHIYSKLAEELPDQRNMLRIISLLKPSSVEQTSSDGEPQSAPQATPLSLVTKPLVSQKDGQPSANELNFPVDEQKVAESNLNTKIRWQPNAVAMSSDSSMELDPNIASVIKCSDGSSKSDTVKLFKEQVINNEIPKESFQIMTLPKDNLHSPSSIVTTASKLDMNLNTTVCSASSKDGHGMHLDTASFKLDPDLPANNDIFKINSDLQNDAVNPKDDPDMQSDSASPKTDPYTQSDEGSPDVNFDVLSDENSSQNEPDTLSNVGSSKEEPATLTDVGTQKDEPDTLSNVGSPKDEPDALLDVSSPKNEPDT